MSLGLASFNPSRGIERKRTEGSVPGQTKIFRLNDNSNSVVYGFLGGESETMGICIVYITYSRIYETTDRG